MILTNNYQIDIETLDLSDKTTQENLLTRTLTKTQLRLIFQRIQMYKRSQSQSSVLNVLNTFKKDLKSKYSIVMSNRVLSKFIKTSLDQPKGKTSIDFYSISKEIKETNFQIIKKKFQIKQEEQNKHKSNQRKRYRKNVLYQSQPYIPNMRCIKSLDKIFVKQKIAILKDYLTPEQLNQFEQQIKEKIDAIDTNKYGKYSTQIKSYTIYDYVIQKIFTLIQKDTHNINIRQKYRGLYKKMKEEMISITINQHQIRKAMKAMKAMRRQISCEINQVHPRTQQAKFSRKTFFKSDKSKTELQSQIEETLENAERCIKEAFICKKRPDLAYQTEKYMREKKETFSFDFKLRS